MPNIGFSFEQPDLATQIMQAQSDEGSAAPAEGQTTEQPAEGQTTEPPVPDEQALRTLERELRARETIVACKEYLLDNYMGKDAKNYIDSVLKAIVPTSLDDLIRRMDMLLVAGISSDIKRPKSVTAITPEPVWPGFNSSHFDDDEVRKLFVSYDERSF